MPMSTNTVFAGTAGQAAPADRSLHARDDGDLGRRMAIVMVVATISYNQ
jgi:hypothetical protein